MSPLICITGGAGFIGSAVAERFIAANWEVAVIDDLSSGKRKNVPQKAKFFQQDVCDAETKNLIVQLQPEVICHQAAQIDVRRSMYDPVHDCKINLCGLLNILEGARLAKTVQHIVFASSGGAIYGDTEQIPTPESHPAYPVSNYGVAKAASELYLGVYYTNYGISYTALRYANVYGPRQDPHGEAGVVAIFSDKLLANQPCIIYGDGRQTRDYVFVKDVAQANFLAVQKQYLGAVNIGTGIETDVNELYANLTEVAGVSLTTKYVDARVGEQRRSCIDTSLAARVLGWSSQVSLKTGLAKTYSWFKQKKTNIN
ncbi:MAG: GDP-mannose 4,6-dehydratase [Deltaproteobacteria bacterium]|nr:GDP-mannose 4,6-dehydratase [Deltaproteobacteria bacterium]